MRLLTAFIGVLAVLASSVLARAIPEGEDAVGARDSVVAPSSNVPDPEAKAADVDRSLSLRAPETLYCGYGYTNKGLRDHPIALQGDGVIRSIPQPGAQSAKASSGCRCLIGRDGPYSGWQGDLSRRADKFDCSLPGNLATEAGAKRDTLDAGSWSTKPPSEGEAGCGYTQDTFRGDAVPLTLGSQYNGHIMTTFKSAKVCKGYACNFYNNTKCSHSPDGSNDEFINLDGFKGSLPWYAGCTYCFSTNKPPKTPPKVCPDSAEAGCGYTESSFRGDMVLLTTENNYYGKIKSVQVKSHYTCDFYKESVVSTTVCAHVPLQDDEFHGEHFKGNLPWYAGCTKCYGG